MCMCGFVYVYVCVCMCIHDMMYVYACVCVCVCMCMYVYVSIYHVLRPGRVYLRESLCAGVRPSAGARARARTCVTPSPH